MFVNLYDLDVIEEEAFLKWRDDVSDDHPGKGKALFQVHRILSVTQQKFKYNMVSLLIGEQLAALARNSS
jgi:hypothetical protein